jgi:hypothetical protein
MWARLKETVRKHRNSKQSALRIAAEAASMAYRCVRAPARFCTDGIYRSTALLRLFNGRELHQTTPLTWMDRYPKIFSASRDYFGARDGLRILSYGCSTGEEVLTLRSYFPEAFIVGTEINRNSLSMCRKHAVDDRIVFLESCPEKIRAAGPFDAIFCMAVLQRTPMELAERGVTYLNKIYPFEKFDRKVVELDSWLKKNGLLIIRHSQYSLADASVSSKYAPVDTATDIQRSIFIKLRD